MLRTLVALLRTPEAHHETALIPIGQRNMTRGRAARHGEGTAWLVADCSNEEFMCYWYFGAGDGRLAAHARVSGESEAVAWGRERSGRVRLRATDGRTFWAGTDAKPDAIALIWRDQNPTGSTNPASNAEEIVPC